MSKKKTKTNTNTISEEKLDGVSGGFNVTTATTAGGQQANSVQLEKDEIEFLSGQGYTQLQGGGWSCNGQVYSDAQIGMLLGGSGFGGTVQIVN